MKNLIKSQLLSQGWTIQEYKTVKNNMKQEQSPILHGARRPFLIKWMIVAAITASVLGCKKSGGSGSGGSMTPGGGGALLAQEVLVARNSSNAVIDSVVTVYQYDANKNLSGIEQTTISSYMGFTSNTVLTYSLTYSGTLISGLTGTFTQNVGTGVVSLSASTEINTVFQASGGQIVSYVQSTQTTGSPALPITQITGNDSALLAYDGNGNISGYTIYQKAPGSTSYSLLSRESFTYSGGNWVGSVVGVAVGGIIANTFTTVYQYNSKISAAPIYIIPGVPINSMNDLSQSTETETGANPGSNTSVYSTTYNGTNQPVSSTVALTVTPTDPGNPATETISYTYQ
jgi:hypothetical protein